MENDMRKKMYIKLYYSLLDWAWINHPNTLVVFIHLLLNANRKDQPYHKGIIRKGEVLASYEFLSERTGLSAQQVRRAVENLISTGDISRRQLGKTCVYTLNCWSEMENCFVDYNFYDYNNEQNRNNGITDEYNRSEHITDSKPTTYKQQTDNEPATLIYCKNEDNENNEILKECESEKTHAHGKLHNVFISQENYDEFRKEFPYIADEIIDQLSEKIATGDKQYKTGHIGHLYVFARNYRQEKKTETYNKPSYDINLALQKAKKLDPTKTKRER